MVLVDVTALPWRMGRMKRNMSLFTNLLRSVDFEAGVYVNTTRVVRQGAGDLFRRPQITTAATHEIDSIPVTVLQPDGAFPLSSRLWWSSLASGRLLARDLQRLYAGHRKFCLWANSITPIECGIVDYLSRHAEITIFDNSDDMPTLEAPHMLEDAKRRLRYMLKRADKVVCVNQHVADTIDHPDKRVFLNGTTYESLQTSGPVDLPPWFPKPAGSVYVGFVGSFHETRIDVPLIDQVFRAFPEYTFLIVGWVSPSLEPVVARYPNVHYVGEVSNERLGAVIRSFDAGIIPHLDNTATRGNDLLKLLDFNACEVPVVSTRVSGVDKGSYVVHLASTPEEFAGRLRECVEGRHGLDLKGGREAARQRSWEVQVPHLARELGLPIRRQAVGTGNDVVAT